MAANKTSAIKITAMCLSILGGLASLGHGIFEILQGNIPADSIRIEAIGPAQRFWEYGGEPALTIIPNYLITGILSTLISLSVIVWAFLFIDKKYGLWGMIILVIFMLLFGGGFAPPTFMLLAIVTTTHINKSLAWWDKLLPYKLKHILAGIWPWALFLLVISVLFAIEAGIFGYPLIQIFNADIALKFLSSFGLITTFGIGPLVILAAFAYDLLHQD